jgi:hypothetical protein
MLEFYMSDFHGNFSYTYSFKFQTSKSMDSPSLKELFYFLENQFKKGIGVDLYDMKVNIKASSVEDSAKKYKKFIKNLFLFNPDLDVLYNMTGLELKELQREMK